MRRMGWMSALGLLLAGGLALAFADWLAFADPGPGTARRASMAQLSIALIAGEARADHVYSTFRVGFAVVGLGVATVAAWVFAKASNSLPARLVGWMLVGTAGFAFAIHFATVDPRYGLAKLPPRPQELAYLLATMWLATLAARFLVVFPRPLDGDSVMSTFWARRRRCPAQAGGWRKVLHDPLARSRVLLPWHAGLVQGRLLWQAPLAAAALVPVGYFVARVSPAYDLGGIWVTLIAVAIGWYALYGLPFAWASTAHLYQNGSEEERRRVSWLRAVGLLAAAVGVAFFVLFWVQIWIVHNDKDSLALAGAWMLGVQFLPIALVGGIAFAVLRGGALDARLAFTRVTVWSVLGLAMTVGFLLVERYVAVKIVAWLSLPPDSGAVMAGAAIAASFVPVRRATERTVTRIAERYLPLSAIAGGARVEKTVLICDISGYTALSAHDEPRALLLGALLKRLGERAAGANGGRLVKSMGDAVMVTFADNDGAVRAARALHGEFPAAARAVAVEPLPLHSALHRGEIVESHDGDIYGQTVNVCARLVDAAAAGEIVGSAAALPAAGDAAGLRSIGPRRFKNVPQALECFRLEASRGTAVPAREPDATLAS